MLKCTQFRYITFDIVALQSSVSKNATFYDINSDLKYISKDVDSYVKTWIMNKYHIITLNNH